MKLKNVIKLICILIGFSVIYAIFEYADKISPNLRSKEKEFLKSNLVASVDTNTFHLKDVKKHIFGRGLIAMDCTLLGWDYYLVLPRFDKQSYFWYEQMFNMLQKGSSHDWKPYKAKGKEPYNMCGYGWDKQLGVNNYDKPVKLDIGANIGLSVMPYAVKGWKVIAFEPLESNVEVLRANLWINNIKESDVTVVQAAVGNQGGIIPFYVPKGREDNSATNAEVADLNVKTGNVKKVMVPSITIDAYMLGANPELKQNIQLIKIDVQGHELNVLQGMKQFLQATERSVKVIVEVDHKLQRKAGHEPNEIIDFMYSIGYLAFCRSILQEYPKQPTCYDVTFIK
tara:strand:+ start:15639 stop:16661 length:1023 start_codon:yes stop_codon:yes gene_type:complete